MPGRASTVRHGRSPRLPSLPLLALLAVATTHPAPGLAAPCDVDVTLDVSPRTPPDGATLGYTLIFCDPTGYGADVGSTFIGVSRSYFVPWSGGWITCPRSTCGRSGSDGNMTIGGFTLAASECLTYEFELDSQPGLIGQRICLQGRASVASKSPPPSPFPCNKETDDPTTPFLQDATCVTVEDPAPGCDLTASISPTTLLTCAGSGDILTCTATESGCPGSTLSYEWTRDGVPVPGLTDPIVTIPASEPPGGHQYRCLVACAALPECRQASLPAQVTVFASAASVIVPASACIDQDVTVSVLGAITCVIDCGNGSPVVSTCSHTCRYPSAGRYTVAVTTYDGFCEVTDQRRVDIFDQPSACIDAPSARCETASSGPTAIPLGNCSTAGLEYRWSSSLGSLDDPAAETPVLTLPDVTVSTAVTVSLTVTDPNGCGSPDSTQATFDLLPAPTAIASASPDPACVDQDVDFTGDTAGAPGPFDYHWDFGDTMTSTLRSPTHVYTAAGSYDVTFSVTDRGSGCSASTPLPLTVEVCSSCPNTIPAVERLLATRSLSGDDVELTWLDLTEAQDGYNVWAVSSKQEIVTARAPGGPGVRAVCVPTSTTDCLDPGRVPVSAGSPIFYQVRGVCGPDEGE